MNIVSPRARALGYSVMLMTATAVIAATSQGSAISHDAVPQNALSQDAISQDAASHHQDDADRKDHGDRDRRGAYSVHNLVSDGFVPADHTDPDLVNPWGVVFAPNAPVWVNDNGTGLSTLYDGLGVKQALVVTVPPPTGGTPPSLPTGIVSNSSTGFVVTQGAVSAASRFIFATLRGTISGWAPTANPTNAIVAVDRSNEGAIYTGLALAANGTGNFLYAVDFHNNRIDVFNSSFQLVTLSGSFSDPRLPDGYAPFGIQNILGNLYVTYAKQDEAAQRDVPGPGLGFVNVFDANGHLIRRFASRGRLNAPWGVALAPADFGRFSNTLLIGNFGDGRINAFDLQGGEPRGRLRTADGQAIVLDGLWGIAFGNGVINQPTNVLFFAAGPGEEEHGLYGRIEAVQKNHDDE
jgi:uncharacterized protein (TIGR03118 family)